MSTFSRQSGPFVSIYQRDVPLNLRRDIHRVIRFRRIERKLARCERKIGKKRKKCSLRALSLLEFQLVGPEAFMAAMPADIRTWNEGEV